MNKILLGLSLILLIACGNPDQFVINGKLSNIHKDIKKVFLYEGGELVDSAFLNEDAEFRFKRSTPSAQFYSLMVSDRNYFLVLQNGEKVDFSANLEDPKGDYQIEGSATSGKIKAFSEINAHYGAIFKEIEGEFQMQMAKRPADEDSIRKALLGKYQTNMDAFSKAVLDFANKNKDNLAGFYAINSLDPTNYEREMMAYAEAIKDKFPGNQAVNEFVAHMAELKPLSIGHKAPDFELMDPKGKTVKLSDFRGKYLLVDFWASWCVPCREENPNVVEQYQHYKDKNFTILGVSLDNDQAAWIKAIQDDHLDWTQVSDLQAWNSKAVELYKVSAIPASFLLDPDGVIIAKNLRGTALADFLKEKL